MMKFILLRKRLLMSKKNNHHQLVDDLGFEAIAYDDVLDRQVSPFCRLNPDGFTGTKQYKQGFIIGPTLKPENIDPDQNHSSQYFEIFAPKVYLKETATTTLKSEYRLLVAQFESLTYILLLKSEEYKMSENSYRDLYQTLHEKSVSIYQSIDAIVEFNDSNPIYEEDRVKFYYYNSINLAIKFTPYFDKNVLSNEIRHHLNIIKEKFDSNDKLNEYQITTTNYWL